MRVEYVCLCVCGVPRLSLSCCRSAPSFQRHFLNLRPRSLLCWILRPEDAINWRAALGDTVLPRQIYTTFFLFVIHLINFVWILFFIFNKCGNERKIYYWILNKISYSEKGGRILQNDWRATNIGFCAHKTMLNYSLSICAISEGECHFQ